MRRPNQLLWLCYLAGWLAIPSLGFGAEYRGRVVLHGVAVPGVSVSAAKGDSKLTSVTDEQGFYFFSDLTNGSWTVEVSMTGFAIIKREVTIPSDAAVLSTWELQFLRADQVSTVAMQAAPVPGTVIPKSDIQRDKAANEPPPPAEAAAETSDGLLINGSVNNAAASPFSQAAAFGNNRNRQRGLYTGGIALFIDNSALDAQPFSLTGQNSPKLSYNNLAGAVTFGGPLRIPHFINNGPNLFVAYQWRRDRAAQTQPALVPDAAERNGTFASSILDPLTGAPFNSNTIPQNRISPQALALLALYPLPNFTGSSRYNYQVSTIGATHLDSLQSRIDKALNSKNVLFGSFALQSIRTNTPSVLGFTDTTDTLGLNARLVWQHRVRSRLYLILGYQFSRFSTGVTPYFENRVNVSGAAGLEGNNQAPVNWGPPSLNFASGIVSLTDGLPAANHNQTSAVSPSMLWTHGIHSVAFGGDFRRQQFNYLSQQNPRGAFTFTGAATGSDFADFLLGVPDTASIAFGNADKYFRESVYDGFVADDFRARPELTLNVGVRWEYSAPISELYNRFVNLGVTPGFELAAPVLASKPINPLTGQTFPNSLLRPDRSAWEPRIGMAWRPLPGSSLVLRGGYGVYYNTSVYQSIANQLAQQPPLSKAFSVQNSAATPLTLANGFNTPTSTVSNTFGIDPDFRVGYAQIWQLSAQRDLPRSLQLTAGYLGIKGTRGLQEFLPNTFPSGAINPCLRCPAGFIYLKSNGNSTREAGNIQLRRRLHNGFTALAQYTFSKSIDDVAAFGGQGAIAATPLSQSPTAQGAAETGAGAAAPAAMSNAAIAQNWQNLRAERARSNFDQRHLLVLQAQYTTGMGLGGGTLLSGWRGALVKEWTLVTQVTVGSGLPLTPIYLTAVPGTGVTGTIRPDYTGAPLYSAPAGLAINPLAFAVPASGQWGNAGRNIITGPAQFALNSSLGRTFRLKDRLNLDLRVDSTNALNHVTFSSWDTTINNAQFGLPVAANAMRSLQTSLRLRF